MIQHVRNSSRLVFILFVTILLASAGCKSKKKAMEAQAAAEKARLEQEAAQKKQRDEEERQRAEATEKARREAEAMLRDREPKAKLQEYFNAIGSANSFASANSSINEALALFASQEAPVLIVISEYNGQKDYDRPTTIKEYLNYLKDQKKQADQIGEIKYDSAGKITELELVKRK